MVISLCYARNTRLGKVEDACPGSQGCSVAEPAQIGRFDSWRALLANSLSSGPAVPDLGAPGATFPPHPGYTLLGRTPESAKPEKSGSEEIPAPS